MRRLPDLPLWRVSFRNFCALRLIVGSLNYLRTQHRAQTGLLQRFRGVCLRRFCLRRFLCGLYQFHHFITLLWIPKRASPKLVESNLLHCAEFLELRRCSIVAFDSPDDISAAEKFQLPQRSIAYIGIAIIVHPAVYIYFFNASQYFLPVFSKAKSLAL